MENPKPQRARKPSPRWNNALASVPDPHEVRKRALVLAAGRAFGVKGFHNTTLDDIAKSLSVTKPALYRYVRNKQDILYECHRIAIEMAEQSFEVAMQSSPDALQALRSYVEGYIRKMTSELGTCVVLTEYYSMTPQHTRLIQQRRRKLDAQLRQLVAQCIDEGRIAPCDPKLAVFFIMGATNSINRWFSESGSASGDFIAGVFADHALHSLQPLARPARAAAQGTPRAGRTARTARGRVLTAP